MSDLTVSLLNAIAEANAYPDGHLHEHVEMAFRAGVRAALAAPEPQDVDALIRADAPSFGGPEWEMVSKFNWFNWWRSKYAYNNGQIHLFALPRSLEAFIRADERRRLAQPVPTASEVGE